jgi:peptidoglycan/LPS O-acetylase OafA/YrhL
MINNKIYRTDIEGLRGLSVILVLIYHAKILAWDKLLLPGGLFGVDIFFVVSGYVITLVINNSLKNNSFYFLDFYMRRCRRILPVLIFITFIFLFFYKILLPVDLIDYAKSILNLIITNSNYYFYYTSATYGEQKTLLRLLIHTWSLCVEFQFYILFPIFYLFFFKYYHKYLNTILFLGIILTFIIASYLTYRSPVFSFYVLPSRVWEFLVGILVANIKIKENIFFKSSSNLFSIFGLLMIIYSVLFFSDVNLNPSFFNILPVFGCALIILFGQNNFVGSFLSKKILVSLGTLSYSIYLWHYPIFAISRYTDFLLEYEVLKKIILILIIFFLSFLTYRTIEKPFRNKILISNKFFKIFTIISLLFLALISYAVIKYDGFSGRLNNYKMLHEVIYPSKFPELVDQKDKETCFGRQNKFCIFNKNGKSGKIFLIGDSHMRNISSLLSDDLVKLDYEVQIMIDRDCWYAPGFQLVYASTNRKLKFCTYEFHQNIRNIIINEKDAIIVFGGRLPRYLSNKSFDNKEGGVETENFSYKMSSINKNEILSDKIKSSINELSLKNKIILIYPIPEVGWDISRKVFNNFNFNYKKEIFFNTKSASTSYNEYFLRSKQSFKLLNNINKKNIFRIYPHNIVCNNFVEKRCIVYYENNVYYTDNNHPSLLFSKLIAEQVKNIVLGIKKIY